MTVARVVAVFDDLLLGSNVQGALQAAGHAVDLVRTQDDAAARAGEADVLVVDLASPGYDAPALARVVRAGGDRPRLLGVHSHVDVASKERALAAGFDLVVPRSRMAREGAALVARLAGDA